jgi:TolB-like protein/Tfp pilus assembly protein PilF
MSRFIARKLFHELRRRRVFRTIALYIVGAWVALQVSELILPAFGISSGAIRFVWLGAFALSPLVLIFGWRYDVTTGGIRRTLAPNAPDDSDRTLKTVDQWIIGVLSASALAVVISMTVLVANFEEDPGGPIRNSVAVMPFEVCEGQLSDVILAGALTGEVIRRLAERGQLSVIGRNSSEALAGFGPSLPKIARLLRVEYLLTGVVCRDGLELTLAVELTDRDGFVTWQGSYVQATNRLDKVEHRLASTVADAVAAKLGDVLVVTTETPVNRLALEQLLIGQQHRWEGNRDDARAALEKALEYEPDYAEAVFELALLENDLDDDMAIGTGIRKAWPVGSRALDLATAELRQGRADYKAHEVIGWIQHIMALWEQGLTWRDAKKLGEAEVHARMESARARFREAESHWREALHLNPSATDLRLALAFNLDRQGVERRQEAFELLEQGLALDPFDAGFNVMVARRFAGRGQYAQGMDLLDRFESLPQGKKDVWWDQLEIQMDMSAWDDKFETLVEMLVNDPEAYLQLGNLGHLYMIVTNLIELGLKTEAEALYGLLEDIPIPEKDRWWRDFFLVEWYLFATGRGDEVNEKYIAQIAGMSNEEILDAWSLRAQYLAGRLWDSGERERAIELLEALRHTQMGPRWLERQPTRPMSLARWYLEVGRDEDAAPLLEETADALEAEVEAGSRHPQTLGSLAQVYAYQGGDDAMDLLARAVDYGYVDIVAYEYLWEEEGFSNPWDRFREDPRFVEQWNRAQALIDEQRANIRALLAQQDMHALLAPVVSLWSEQSAAASTDSS